LVQHKKYLCLAFELLLFFSYTKKKMAAQSMNALRWAARDCSGLVSPFSFSRNTISLKNPMISDKNKKRQQLAIVAETDRLPVKAAALAETLLPAEHPELAETQLPVKAAGWAAWDTTGVLSPFKFSRRETGPYDVQFKVLYCGICHSDLHFLKNEWAQTIYPIVPGHEVVG
ncbi:alcohol dehydrogenase catalytic domain-containing protein, partial [Acinetobacter baumannii]